MGELGIHKKHINFVEVNNYNPKGITCVWEVEAIDGTLLGSIKWYPQWRQYCFFPMNNTLHNAGCLNDIADFMKNNRNKRKDK